MVAAEGVGLHPEQVLGVPQVGAKVAGHARSRREQLRERLLVRPHDGILLVDDVEGHGPVVGVGEHLHRVAHVVERRPQPTVARQPVGGRPLAVGIVTGGRVGVLHPEDPALEHDRIRVAVVVEERRGLPNAVTDIADVHGAGL